MTEKLKSFLLDDAIFYALLLVCIAVVAFLLGRNSLSQPQLQRAGVSISQAQLPVLEQNTANQSNDVVSVVASRSGTKYHLPTCPGAKQIKESNLITFSSIDQAKAAGYGPAANCNGL